MTLHSTRREKNNAKAFKILILIVIMYVACHGIIVCLNAVELLAIITGRQLCEVVRAVFLYKKNLLLLYVFF